MSMNVYRYLWVFMGVMGVYRYLWVSMSDYEFLGFYGC